MATRRRNAQPPPPPPKKKRTGLIIGIIIGVVVLIAIIVIVIILVLRSRKKKTTTGGGGNNVSGNCTSTADCASGRVCNTSTSKCVACLTNSNCTGTKKTCDNTTNSCVGCLTASDCNDAQLTCDTASKTCIPIECSVSADCTDDPAKPVCASGLCKDCLNNTDCANNPVYSGSNPQRLLCDTAANTCDECLGNTDCPTNSTCVTGTCCNLTVPVFTGSSSSSFVASLGSTSLNFNYGPGSGGSSFNPLNDKVIVSILPGAPFGSPYGPVGPAIYTTALADAFPANGTISITETQAGVTFFPAHVYFYKFKIVRACGTTDWSATAQSAYYNYNRKIVPPPGNVFLPSITLNASLFIYNAYNYYNNLMTAVGRPMSQPTNQPQSKATLLNGITLNAGIECWSGTNDEYNYYVTPFEVNSRLAVYIYKVEKAPDTVSPNIVSTSDSKLIRNLVMSTPTSNNPTGFLKGTNQITNYYGNALYNIPMGDLSAMGLSVGSQVYVVFWTEKGTATSGPGMSQNGIIKLTFTAT